MNLLFAILSLCLLVAGSQPSSPLITPLANEESHLAGQLTGKSLKSAPKQNVAFVVTLPGYLYASKDIRITRYVFKGGPRRFLSFKPPLFMMVLVNAGDALFEASANGTPITFRAPYKAKITELWVKTGDVVKANTAILRFDPDFIKEVTAADGA